VAHGLVGTYEARQGRRKPSPCSSGIKTTPTKPRMNTKAANHAYAQGNAVAICPGTKSFAASNMPQNASAGYKDTARESLD